MSTHTTQTPTSTPPPAAVKGKGVIISVLLGLAFILLIVKFHNWREKSKVEEAKQTAMENARRQAMTMQRMQQRVVATPIPTRTPHTSYTFAQDGCVRDVHLFGDWTDYPVGVNAEIQVIDKNGRIVFTHKAGEKPGSSLPGGYYSICRVTEGTTGVDIW